MILSEKNYIEDLLENGLSPTPNPYEIQLLTTFYRQTGKDIKEETTLLKSQGKDTSKLEEDYKKYKNKEAVKELIKEKCERYYSAPYTTYFAMMNSNIEKGWNRKTPFKEIPNIKVNREVLDWFLMQDFNETYKKILFSLYIQMRIQDVNLNSTCPSEIQNWSRKKNWSKFKQYADVPNSITAEKVIEQLKARQYIETNIFSTSFKVTFINNDIFQGEVNKNAREMSHYEMEHPAEFLQQYLNGTFICSCCGRVSGYRSSSKKSQVKQKYCNECAEKMHIEMTLKARKGKLKNQ